MVVTQDAPSSSPTIPAPRTNRDSLFAEWATWPDDACSVAFESPFAVHAVFRALPPLARLYCVRFLFGARCVSARELNSWVATNISPNEFYGASIFISNSGEGGAAVGSSTSRKKNREMSAAYLKTLFSERQGTRLTIKTEHATAVESLIRVRILKFFYERDPPSYEMNEVFARSLLQVITNTIPLPFSAHTQQRGDPNQPSKGLTSTRASAAVDPKTVKMLEAFSKQRWERVLHFLVGSDSESLQKLAPSADLIRALLETTLLEGCDEGLRITHIGFQFLLKDLYSQVWTLLMSIVDEKFGLLKVETVETDVDGDVDMAEMKRTKFAKQEAMDVLFQMAFCVVGKEYSIQGMSLVHIEFLAALDELGLIQLRLESRERITAEHLKRAMAKLGNDVSFVVTRVGACLLASERNDSSAKQDHHYSAELGELQLIVETNFRVYAYTSSSFQVALLSLFLTMRYRLPNMAVGHLTKGSARAAMHSGITADQLLHFMNSHLHPMVVSGQVPPCVRDELYLWEAERDRVKTDTSVMLDNFETEEGYQKLLRYVDDIGALVWSHDRRKIVLIRVEHYDQVKKFIQENELR